MPIISKYNLIFIHIPKTAGTSIEYSLDFKPKIKDNLKNCLKKWYGNVNGYELDHSTMKFLMENCNFYNKDYLSFSVVRNPYERLVSEYNYCKQNKSRFIKNTNTFRDFVHELKNNFNFVLNNEEKQHHKISHYLPQYKFTHINEKCKIDYIIRFENLNDDWNNFCKKINNNLELLKVQKVVKKIMNI